MATITIGKSEDKARLVRTIGLGFSADPIARWATPDTMTYLDSQDEFFTAFGGAAFDHGTAFVADDGAAVALWLPPGVAPDGERMYELITGQLPPERVEEMGAFFARMDEFHPKDPHWYLPLIATDPAYQSQGLGGALMERALVRVDQDRLPAYLEASSERNVPFYRRHGFEPLGEIKTATSPAMTPMLRPAR